jgi:hypothetical protein
MNGERNMSDKKRTTVTTIETHEVWIIRRATVPELPDEGAAITRGDIGQPATVSSLIEAIRNSETTEEEEL